MKNSVWFEVIEKLCGLMKFKNFESEGGLVKLAPTFQLQPAQGIDIESDVVTIVFNPAYEAHTALSKPLEMCLPPSNP